MQLADGRPVRTIRAGDRRLERDARGREAPRMPRRGRRSLSSRTSRPTPSSRSDPFREPVRGARSASRARSSFSPWYTRWTARLRGDGAQVLGARAVQVTAKRAACSFRRKQAGRVQLLAVDVLGVGGEREREPGDHRGEPRNGRRPMRVVRVQMSHVPGLAKMVAERDRLQKLLQVDLPRRRERSVARPHGLCERRRAGPREAERPPPRDAREWREERPQVGAKPCRERHARDAGNGRQVDRGPHGSGRRPGAASRLSVDSGGLIA